MIFEELIKENRPEFIKKVTDISKLLRVKPEWLMFLMWFETAHTLNHKIKNGIGAVGLIQFTKSTAKYLGTTTDALVKMSNVEQLDYVYKHLKPFIGRYNSLVDLYLAIFWPAGVGKDMSYTIKSDIVAIQNPIFDLNKDLDITKEEIQQALLKQVPNKYKTMLP